MEEKELYNCKYCFKEFEPKRRRVQVYCCNSCRSKAYHARKTKSQALATKSIEESLSNNTPTPSKEKMSTTGIGNAAVGTLAADALKALFTKEQNKPATKGDLTLLLEKLNSRYHLITNLAPNALGRHPYYDMVEGVVVYFK
ncbi:hypothetical protein [Psychroserpens ponticola]|uniref:Uncharacterized protein n=1 Tax=Psychroserpens ponticola TaxID=2932268 RepID=A0ABY7RTY6_9FLAO|nr:hypothetical protein [Psychroserpens ponticola]WCO00564.1 hypothetical protein MUN68_010840 [Psychroserpens ponticola]